MTSHIEDLLLNSSNKKNKIHLSSKIISSRTEFISNNIQTNSPKSNTNCITTENENKNIDSEIKDEYNAEQKKQISKKDDSKNLFDKNDKNNEIYSYFINDINKTFQKDQLLYFIFSRLDKDKSLKCNILINNNNYILYSNSQKFILSSKGIFSIFHKNYQIYITREFLDSSIIAHLHSYNQKKEFILYDNGSNPSKLKYKNNNEKTLRRYLLQIKFLNDKKYEHFLVYLPKETYFLNKNYNLDINHKDKLNNKKYNKVNIYENNLPKFDFNLNKYVDNFSNRVKEKSRLNFKILNEGKIAIECGKINEANYILDINYPFSPLEAFSIALSVFIKNK